MALEFIIGRIVLFGITAAWFLCAIWLIWLLCFLIKEGYEND